MQRVKQCGQRRSRRDLASAYLVWDISQRHPFDAVRFEVIFRWPDALRPVRPVEMMHRIRKSRCGLYSQQRPQLAGTTAGLLFDFAGCAVCWVLARLNLAEGNFPAVRAGDEPVPPQQQNPLLLIDHDCTGSRRGPDHTVLKVSTAIGKSGDGRPATPRLRCGCPARDRCKEAVRSAQSGAFRLLPEQVGARSRPSIPALPVYCCGPITSWTRSDRSRATAPSACALTAFRTAMIRSWIRPDFMPTGYAGRFFAVPWCVTSGRYGPACCASRVAGAHCCGPRPLTTRRATCRGTGLKQPAWAGRLCFQRAVLAVVPSGWRRWQSVCMRRGW